MLHAVTKFLLHLSFYEIKLISESFAFPSVFESEYCLSLYHLWFFSMLLKILKLGPCSVFPCLSHQCSAQKQRSFYVPFLFIGLWLTKLWITLGILALVLHENLYLILSSLWSFSLFRIFFTGMRKKKHKFLRICWKRELEGHSHGSVRIPDCVLTPPKDR